MTVSTSVDSCSELNPGDEINATYHGTLVHRGRVTDLAPDHELFWILDILTGGRRLIDMSEMKVARIQGTATGEPGERRESEA